MSCIVCWVGGAMLPSISGWKSHLQYHRIAVVYPSVEAHLAIFADQLAYFTPAMAIKPQSRQYKWARIWRAHSGARNKPLRKAAKPDSEHAL